MEANNYQIELTKTRMELGEGSKVSISKLASCYDEIEKCTIEKGTPKKIVAKQRRDF